MKLTYTWLVLLAAALFTFTACKKSNPTPAYEVQGVKVEVTKFAQAFNGATPELQNAVTQITMNVRYGQYVQALAGLDKLTGDASLTEPQKKIVNEILGQVKQLAQQATAQPGK